MYKIGISGKANTGKNTLAKILKEEVENLFYQQSRDPYKSIPNFNCQSLAFADPIKEMILLMFPGADRKCLFGPSYYRSECIPKAFKNGKPLTYRQALIDLGTEVGRNYNYNIWLENFDKRVDQILQEKEVDLIMVTDVRFRNEFDHLKKNGYYLIRLYRDTDGEEVINHSSELNQDEIKDSEFDKVIWNNKAIHNLRDEVISNIIPNLNNI